LSVGRSHRQPGLATGKLTTRAARLEFTAGARPIRVDRASARPADLPDESGAARLASRSIMCSGAQQRLPLPTDYRQSKPAHPAGLVGVELNVPFCPEVIDTAGAALLAVVWHLILERFAPQA
jgi:hypothetical protein